MPEMAWHDYVGAAGAGAIVVTYLLLQLGKLESDSFFYSALNATGAALILFSLAYTFNAAAFLIEIFWLIISILGMAMAIRKKRKRREETSGAPR